MEELNKLQNNKAEDILNIIRQKSEAVD